MSKLEFIFSFLLIITLNMDIGFSMSRQNQDVPTDTVIVIENKEKQDLNMLINFVWGKAFNHPTFAVWLEKMDGEFIKTLFATEAISTGTWPYGEREPGKWEPKEGHQVRPAALPYWFHKRSNTDSPKIPSHQSPLPDAITGATPGKDLKLITGIDENIPKKFRLLVEVNQTWDWNEYWTNNKFPEDNDYKTSAQPALVYAVTINLENTIDEYYLNPIGHSHYSGKNGWLYTDLSTLTTALDIIKKLKVEIQR